MNFKKVYCFCILILLMTIILFSCSCGNHQIHDNSVSNQVSNQNFAGNASANGPEQIDKKQIEQLPKELFINEDVSDLLYLKDVFTGDPTTKEHNTDDVKASKNKNAQNLIEIIGKKPKEPMSQDSSFNTKLYYEDCDITVGESFICVSGLDIPLEQNSSNTEIVNIVKDNEYMYAMAKYIGLDLDNIYIYKEETTGYSDEGVLDYRITEFTICQRADTPEIQSFNLQFRNITYWFTEDFSNDAAESESISFYGHFVSENKITKITNPISYTNAISMFKSLENETKDDTLSKPNREIIGCKIVYDSTLKNGFCIPCYRFYYCENEDIQYCDIPCCDVETLD